MIKIEVLTEKEAWVIARKILVKVTINALPIDVEQEYRIERLKHVIDVLDNTLNKS